jgi:hypothetical protein
MPKVQVGAAAEGESRTFLKTIRVWAGPGAVTSPVTIRGSDEDQGVMVLGATVDGRPSKVSIESLFWKMFASFKFLV